MARTLLALSCLLVAACSCQAQSGSGSGAGATCATLNCMGVCLSGPNGDYCSCPVDQMLLSDGRSCGECSVGWYGPNCSLRCADKCGGRGHFMRCTSATCVCNPCWNGANCTDGFGYQCFWDYLKAINKEDPKFGGDVPVPPNSALDQLAGAVVKEGATEVVVQTNTVRLEVISRQDVGARDLAKFEFSVSSTGNNAVQNVRNSIKTGECRATLITDDSTSGESKITLNV